MRGGATLNFGVLGLGGGLTGIYSVGFIKAMSELGLRPRIVRANSVNALNFSFAVQHGWDSRPLEKVWLEFIQKNGPKYIFDFGFLDILMALILKRDHVVPMSKGILELASYLDMAKILGSDIALEIVAVNETTNEEEIFGTREERVVLKPEILRQAVIASTSLPGIFPAHPIDGVPCHDVINPDIMNDVRNLIEAGCDKVLILVNSSSNYQKPKKSWFYTKILGEVYRWSNSDIYAAQKAYRGRVLVLRPSRKIETLSRMSFKRGDLAAAMELTYGEGMAILSRLM